MRQCGKNTATDNNIIWRTRLACWITKVTNKYSEYATHYLSTANMITRKCLRVTFSIRYYTVLHCTVLHRLALYGSTPSCIVRYYTVLHCTVLHRLALYGTIPSCIVRYYTVLYCTVLHRLACTVLYRLALYGTTLSCIERYYTVLHCTVLHCLALYGTALSYIVRYYTCTYYIFTIYYPSCYHSVPRNIHV